MRQKKQIMLRMCVQCRERYTQSTLLRLQSFESEIIPFSGMGRSFYVCKACSKLEAFTRHMMGKHKVPKDMHDRFREQLKEIIANG